MLVFANLEGVRMNVQEHNSDREKRHVWKMRHNQLGVSHSASFPSRTFFHGDFTGTFVLCLQHTRCPSEFQIILTVFASSSRA